MPEDRNLQLAGIFAMIGRDLLAADGVAETLDVVVHLAVSTVKGCHHASVSLVRGRRISTEASSGEVPRRVDALQLETNQGPCLDAIRTHEIYISDDLALEDRWPEFATRAARETGVHSMLAFRLFAEEDTMGALNLFSEDVGAFDETSQAFGLVFAAHAAIALSGAQAEERLQREAARRDVIGQAKGILAERRHITPSEAFDALRLASQYREVGLRDVAVDVVETGRDPEQDRAPEEKGGR